MNYFFLIFFSIPFVLFASNNDSGQFSDDCHNWKDVGSAEPARSGYIKNESETIYFDFSKNLWIQLGKDPFVFLERNKEVFILTSSSIQSHTLKIKRKDTLLKMMLILAEIAEKTASEHSWTLSMKNGAGELSAMLMGPKKCSVEPNALGIVCKKEKPCILGPAIENPEKNVQMCAKELGLLETSKLTGISRACEIILDEMTYRTIKQSYDNASTTCKVKAIAFPLLVDLRKTCADARAFINRF